MAIYVTGDTHGADKFSPFGVDGFINRLNMESFPEQKFMTKDDYVVILGDFGGVWDYRGESKKEKHERADLMAVTGKPVLTFTIDFETAKKYREANKMPHQFRRAAWTDLTVEVYL